MELPDELSFLNNILTPSADRFRTHPCLKNDFIQNIWFIDTSNGSNKYISKIDFNITLPNGKLLTSIENEMLLKTFKMWIIAFLSVNSQGKLLSTYTLINVRNKLPYICKLIDYLILRDDKLKVSEFGLEVLSEDDVKELFSCLVSNSDTFESIYDFKNRALSYIYFNTINSDVSIDSVESKVQIDLFDNDKLLDLDYLDDKYLEKLPLMKAWLFNNGFYRRDSKNSAVYEYIVRVNKIGVCLFESKSLWGGKIHTTGDWVDLFNLMDKVPYNIEYGRVNTRQTIESDLIGNTAFIYFRSAWQSLALLSGNDFSSIGIKIPEKSVIDCFESSEIKVKPKGRFKTVPFPVVFSMAEKCINFHLKYGDELISSYVNVVRFIAKRDHDRSLSQSSVDERTRVNKLISDKEFISCLEPKIKKLGCCQISQGKMWGAKELRESKSLISLLAVYFGLVAFIFGILGARRVGEYLSLRHGQAFDKNNRYIIFDREKATKNLGGMRDRIARPMDELCISMLENLERIQSVLIECGYLEKSSFLFIYPYDNPVKILEKDIKRSLYQALDKACDYFESDVVDGLRYYFRPHQLRRFFAQLFVWSSGDSKFELDILRWFLGHTDIEHLHQYLTEIDTGDILRDVKVCYVSEFIDSYPKLKLYILEKYNVSDVELLDSEELEDYINEQIDEGAIELVSEFINDQEGKKHRLLVKITGVDNE